MEFGDMHFAIVAHEELGGEASAAEVALKLGWVGADRRADERRAETALLAAAERGFVGAPR
jgi:hypothetical protein